MDTGRLINKLSNCLRRRSAETQKRIHISGTKGQILNYILIESQKRPLVQRDVEQDIRPAAFHRNRNAADPCRLPISSAANPILRTHGASALSALKKPKPFRPACLQEITETEGMLPAASRPRSGTFMADRAENAFKFEKTINHYRRAGCPAASMETIVSLPK